jgi:iron(III) transport system ATP-binding protein
MMALEVFGVCKSFGRTPVLYGVDLEVAPGTLTTVLGASGAGKTTLLRIIAGFEAADAGVVRLGGIVVDDGRKRVPPERRRIGYVPQDGALFPHLTVRANAAFALPRRERGSQDVDDILELVGLSELRDRYPSELSGGQQQRVAIARALASRPRLVLLDEPFAALDASLRTAVRADVLRVLRTTGTTAVLVTHDQDEALSVSDYVAVLRDGVITQAGPPREVYQTPADPWTASFLGTANLLPGTPEAGSLVRTMLGEHQLSDPRPGPGGAFGDGAAAGGASGALTVLIRPEQIRMTDPEEGQPAGLVTETRYHGHDALITVDAGPAGTLRVRTIGTLPPDPGDKVGLVVDGPVVAWSSQESSSVSSAASSAVDVH